MSIGDTFPYVVPTVGSASWGGPLNNILNELITRTSSTVPLSALAGGNLDMQNTAIEGLRYVKFQEQANVDDGIVGTIQYSDGNFYLVNESGSVQLTDGADLNFSAVGGIGGDYGGGDPASVQFVGATKRYDFYDDFGATEWAAIRAQYFDIANGTTGSNYARVSYAGAGTIDFILPTTLPGSADSVVMIDSAGQLSHNDVANPITNHIFLDTAVYVKHSDRIVHFSPMPLRKVAGTALSSGTWEMQNVDNLQGTAFGAVYIPLPGIQRHWRLKSLKVFMNKTTAINNATVEFMKAVNGVFTIMGTTTVTASGETSGTATIGVPYTPVTNDVFFARITTTVNNDLVRGLEMTYDVV